MKTALSLLAVLFLTQSPQDGAASLQEFRRTNGDSMVGTVASLEGAKVKLRVAILGGSMVVTHKLADFEPDSQFRIELQANPPKDFDQHFAMAKKAADLGLRPQAGGQARAAIAAVKGKPDFEAKEKEVRAWGADALEKMVRDAAAAGNAAQARQCLTILSTRLPEQRTEEQLGAIATVVEELEGKKKEEEANKRQARLDQKQRESIERHLKPIEKDVERGTKTFNDALRKSSTTASARLCEQAIDHYKKAYHSLNGLVEKNPDDEVLAGAATTLGQEIHDNGIRAALHAAQMLCTQSDYKKAMEWTQKVLAFDPTNEDAKRMAETITLAQADDDDWRWGWTIGDIGRVGSGPRPAPRNH